MTEGVESYRTPPLFKKIEGPKMIGSAREANNLLPIREAFSGVSFQDLKLLVN